MQIRPNCELCNDTGTVKGSNLGGYCMCDAGKSARIRFANCELCCDTGWINCGTTQPAEICTCRAGDKIRASKRIPNDFCPKCNNTGYVPGFVGVRPYCQCPAGSLQRDKVNGVEKFYCNMCCDQGRIYATGDLYDKCPQCLGDPQGYAKKKAANYYIQATGAKPIMDSENGAPIGRLAARYDLLPGDAMERAAIVMAEGLEAHGLETWRKISRRSHLNHAIAHVMKWLNGDTEEDHLGHAACRVLFANAILTEDEAGVIDRVLQRPKSWGEIDKSLLEDIHQPESIVEAIKLKDKIVAAFGCNQARPEPPFAVDSDQVLEAIKEAVMTGEVPELPKLEVPVSNSLELEPVHKSIRAYICGPLRPWEMQLPYPSATLTMSMELNTWVAQCIARTVFGLNPDIYPIIPHVQFPYVDDFDPAQRSAVMNHCEDTVALSDVVLQVVYYYLEGDEDNEVEIDYVSEGMQAELAKAEEEGVPVIKCRLQVAPICLHSSHPQNVQFNYHGECLHCDSRSASSPEVQISKVALAIEGQRLVDMIKAAAK